MHADSGARALALGLALFTACGTGHERPVPSSAAPVPPAAPIAPTAAAPAIDPPPRASGGIDAPRRVDPRLIPAPGTPARASATALELTLPPDPSPDAPLRLSVVDGTSALITNGEVIVWGNHPDHVPLRVEHTGPVRLEGIDDAIQVVALPGGAAVLRADGSVVEVTATVGGAQRARPRVPPMRFLAAASSGARCGVTRRGEVHCWGGFGEPEAVRPRRIAGIANARRVAIQLASGVALLADGTVRSFGEGDPVTIPGAVDVATTSWTTCALMRDGTVRCWGERLGRDGHEAAPAVVPGLDGVVSLHGGSRLLCARRRDGSVACLGRGIAGLPVAGAPAEHAAPVEAPMLAGATALAIAQGHACWLVADGTPRCVGENDAGQVGTVPRRSVVLEVPGIGPARWISAWNGVTCAGGADGAHCWGADAWSLEHEAPRPLVLPRIGEARAAWVAGARACLLLPGDVRECWADVGTTPRSLGRLENVLAIAGPCAETREGIECGLDPAHLESYGPYRALTAASMYGGARVCFVHRTVGRAECVELRVGADGRVLVNEAWTVHAGPVDEVTPTAPPYVRRGTAVAAHPRGRPPRALPGAHEELEGGGITCGRQGGAVSCWGWLDVAELMHAAGTPHPDAGDRPHPIPGIDDATALAVGQAHGCALRPGGRVACFADTREGGIGAVPAWVHLDPVTPSLTRD